MKKICLFLVIASMFVSCQQEEDPAVLWKVINLEVKQADWSADTDANGLNRYYFCGFDMPEITPYVYAQGLVQVYNVRDNVQQVLPCVRHYENTAGHTWTQTVDADFSTGNMIIYVTNSDFLGGTPPAMSFRVVLMW